MKLHLPKALLTAVIAAFAGLSQHAMGEILTVNLLSSTTDWTLNGGDAPGSFSIGGGGSNYMIYEFDRQLSATAEQDLSFTLTLNIAASAWTGEYNALTGVAFIGSETAVVMGSLAYDSHSCFGYATSTNTDVNFYNLTGGNYASKPAANVSSAYQSLVDPHPLGQDITVTGTIAKNPADSGSGYTMTLNYSGTTYTVDMGDVVDMERVVFYADGPTPATIKALTMTGYTRDLVEITWAGTSENHTWSSASFAGGAATDDTSQITFGPLSEGISNTVVISGDVIAHSVTITDNYTFQADGVAKLSPGKLTVAADKTLTYGGSGTLTIDSAINCNLNVTGGTLNLKGAEAVTGSKLDIAGGTVFIDCNSGADNASAINKDTAVSIGAGGKLHLKGHDSLGWGSTHGKLASILLKGNDADNKAELVLEEVKKADGTNWDGRNSIGYNIDLQGYSAVTGIGGNNIIQGGSVTASGLGNSITFDYLQVSTEWNVTVNQGGQLAIHAESTQSDGRKAKIVKQGAGELTLSGSYNSEVVVDGGTLSFAGNTNVAIGRLHSKSGHVTVGKDSTNTSKLTVTGIELGDNGSGINDTLYVSEGSLLKITGSTNSDNDMKSASIIIGEWVASTTVTLDGSMLAKDAYVMAGEKGGIININGTGTLAAKGIYKNAGRNDRGVIDIVLNDGGKLILGADGISSDIYTNGITLKDGIVGTYADEMTISKSMTLAGPQGTTFDTDKYAFADDGNSISKQENASASTIIIAAAMSGEGKLVKTGAGTLKLDATNTYSGGTSVEAGMLEVNADEGLGTGKVEVASGATLQIGLGVGITTVSGIDLAGGATLDLRNGGQGNSIVDTAITTGDGAIIRAGFNGSNTIINGSISGSGKLELAQNEWGVTYTTDKWNILAELKDKSETEKLSIIYTEGALAKFSGNNTYSGGTTITGGTLTTASENALGTGTVKMQGGTLEMAAALRVTAMEYTNGAVNNGSHNLNVGTLTVTEGATMSLSGSGATTAAVVDLKNGASLSAAGELTMGSLTMADGSTLAASDTITLSGSDNRVLDLGSKLTLDGEWFNNLLAELTGSKTAALFAGVTELKLNGVAYANQVDLADHFLNVEQGKYYLVYADSVVYAGLGEVIPEPTTATLSLLALAGLCARRRRRA